MARHWRECRRIAKLQWRGVGISSGDSGTKYIQGIPGTENENQRGTEVSSTTGWTYLYQHATVSRSPAPQVAIAFKQEDDGDLVGYSINYALICRPMAARQTVLNTSVTGKTTSGYERSHRIVTTRQYMDGAPA
ncbi:hypothetical protein BANRA_05491 [Escherichia coli]|nr:hypothetical protein BANRA_05491 [Escherichia coli]